jgi:hypothetical protein
MSALQALPHIIRGKVILFSRTGAQGPLALHFRPEPDQAQDDPGAHDNGQDRSEQVLDLPITLHGLLLSAPKKWQELGNKTRNHKADAYSELPSGTAGQAVAGWLAG